MNKLIVVLGTGMMVLVGLFGYGIYDVQQSRISVQEKQWEQEQKQEQERKDLIAKCSSEAVPKAVSSGEVALEILKADTGDQASNILNTLSFPILDQTMDELLNEEGAHLGYAYATYQQYYSVCMQSHGIDLGSL